ncbi:hypothetical protein HK101_003464, partial [Irineochytrium annulatum]
MPKIDHCMEFSIPGSPVHLAYCSTDAIAGPDEEKNYVQAGLAFTTQPTNAMWTSFYTNMVVDGVFSTVTAQNFTP